MCFVTLIKSSGVVAATTITTLRKILSIILSFILYPKAFSSKYAFGMAVFVASVVIGVWGKEREYKRKSLEDKRKDIVDKPNPKDYTAVSINSKSLKFETLTKQKSGIAIML